MQALETSRDRIIFASYRCLFEEYRPQPCSPTFVPHKSRHACLRANLAGFVRSLSQYHGPLTTKLDVPLYVLHHQRVHAQPRSCVRVSTGALFLSLLSSPITHNLRRT